MSWAALSGRSQAQPAPGVTISGNLSRLSPAYIVVAMANCRRLFRHWMRRAFSLALANAGNNIAARIAMIAITTSNSMSVNADTGRCTVVGRLAFMLDNNLTFIFLQRYHSFG